MHGLVQSQAVTRAAQELSAARAALNAGKSGAAELVEASKERYRVAVLTYTDPFNVKNRG